MKTYGAFISTMQDVLEAWVPLDFSNPEAAKRAEEELRRRQREEMNRSHDVRTNPKNRLFAMLNTKADELRKTKAAKKASKAAPKKAVKKEEPKASKPVEQPKAADAAVDRMAMLRAKARARSAEMREKAKNK